MTDIFRDFQASAIQSRRCVRERGKGVKFYIPPKWFVNRAAPACMGTENCEKPALKNTEVLFISEGAFGSCGEESVLFFIFIRERVLQNH